MAELQCWKQIGDGFYNLKAPFKIFLFFDIGTHMSLAKLSSGKFVAIDAVELSPEAKKELDQITNSGELLESVVATHPFHTKSFPSFCSHYPNAKYYGTPRHLKFVKNIPWAGDLNECKVRSSFEPDLFMRIPAGSEFVNPLPPTTNHFSNIFVFHPRSKTIHDDDTITVPNNPNFLLKWLGFKPNTFMFHMSMKGPGLYPTKEAPLQFKGWLDDLIHDWDFDNFVTAHNGDIIGGAKTKLKEAVEKIGPVLEKLSARNATGDPKIDQTLGGYGDNDKTTECG